MKETAVHITIHSLQYLDTGKETVTQQADGTLRQTAEGWLLTYREGESSGLGDTLTTLEIGPDRAVLTRRGELNSRMVFRPGEPHTSLYETPYGGIPMTLRALSLKSDLGEGGGHITIHYQIKLGGGSAGETRLRLTVQAKENKP